MATVEDPSFTKTLSSTVKTSNTQHKVIFQKVIRPPPGLPDILFLGYLVEYLEQHFKLPADRLPMVYETQYMDNEHNSGISSSDDDNRSLLAWDSPLSPSSEATRMELEVVGVYTNHDDNGDNHQPLSTVPSMAMVVVRKAKSDGSNMNAATIPPMMQNLFQDSEKKILQALDRGLEEFGAGNIQFDVEEKQRVQATANEQRDASATALDEILDAEIVEPTNAMPISSRKTSPDDVVFDAYATTDNDFGSSIVSDQSKATRTKADSKAKARAMETMRTSANKNAKENADKKGPVEVDFAVQAAKKIAQKRKSAKAKGAVEKDSNEDFAVAAARQVAAKRKSIKKSDTIKASENSTTSRTQKSNSKRKNVKGSPAVTTEPGIKMPPADDDWDPTNFLKDTRKLHTILSTPDDVSKGVYKNKKRKNWKELAAKMASTTFKEEFRTGNTPNPVKVVKSEAQERPSNKDPSLDKPSIPSELKSVAEKDMEIAEAANKALDEIAEHGQDMSAEDLLRDVLKFDDEQKKEESTGSGFVSGAFEKAKELLKDRNQQLLSKGKQVGFKEVNEEESDRPLTAEEELKAMFAAGQQFAEGRITQRLSKNQLAADRTRRQAGTTEADVDELIAQEKSISSHARKLDEELAELELCINQSPGEEYDPPRENPLFDIMSGPEVYNPNVELDSVNYPGALPGSKKVRLPKELNEAVRQADFAASILSNLNTVEEKGENGEKQMRYFAGKTELTEEQLDNLQRVVEQGSRIGIIEDPLILMAERARLQLILDELWNQPEERFQEVASSFKDLLLSNNFVSLIRERLRDMAERDLEALRQDDDSLKENHEREREILGMLVVYAQRLLQEARALGAELEAQQLEVVRSICKVAMDPSHVTEEDTALALSDAVRDMRPMLDDVFVAYLKYAVAEEEAKLARQGVLDDPDYNQWLFVLKIVQQGVYAEIAKGINRYIEHIWYVLRMETPRQRRMLLESLIDDMPTMDVRPFVQVVDNIVGSLGDGVKGDFDGVVPLGEMTNKLLQLQQDVKTLLPPERIAEKSKDADEWAAAQKKRLMEQRKVGEQRLKAARETESRQDEIDDLLTLGESERFD
jgi:hypothetical protein